MCSLYMENIGPPSLTYSTLAVRADIYCANKVNKIFIIWLTLKNERSSKQRVL